MIRMLLHKGYWSIFAILLFSGCTLFPVRQDTAAPQAAVPAPANAAYHYSLGILYALNDDLGEATRELEEALRLDPASPYLAKELASLYMERGNAAKALEICLKTLREHPDDTDTRHPQRASPCAGRRGEHWHHEPHGTQ